MRYEKVGFRPTDKVGEYLEGLENKNRRINMILEWFVDNCDIIVSKDGEKVNYNSTEIPTENFVEKPVDSKVDILNLGRDIIKKIENKDQLADDKPKKDKKYFKDLELYREIKKRHGIADKEGAWMDTKEALEYSGLTNFIELE